MNTREIDLNPSVEDARERIWDGQGEVMASTFTSSNGSKKVTVTFSITVDAVSVGKGNVQ